MYRINRRGATPPSNHVVIGEPLPCIDDITPLVVVFCPMLDDCWQARGVELCFGTGIVGCHFCSDSSRKVLQIGSEHALCTLGLPHKTKIGRTVDRGWVSDLAPPPQNQADSSIGLEALRRTLCWVSYCESRSTDCLIS